MADDVAGASTKPSSPLVWRRWLGSELVRLRSAAGFKQREIAKALGCSIGRVSYLEKGERSPTVQELRDVLLPRYRVPEREWPAYLQAVAAANERGWWDDWGGDELPRPFHRYVGLEDGAQRLGTYQPSAVPGLLQTPDYATAVLRSLVTESPARVRRSVELRRARQAILSRQPNPLNATFVVDESALRRQIGGVETLRLQLGHIVDVVDRAPNVEVLVVPFSVGGHGAFMGPFSILDFGLPRDAGLVFVESFSGLTFIESPSDVRLYSEAFHRLVDLSLGMKESMQMIRSLAAGAL